MKLTSRENKLFYVLSKFNVISIDNIRDYCIASSKSISLKRLNDLEKNRFIKKISIIERNSEEIICYKLDTKGAKEAKNQGLVTYMSNSHIHDFKHSSFVFNNFEISDFKYYKHEKELPSAMKGASRADGAFLYPDAKPILVETYTRNYTDEMKKAKILYSYQLDAGILINNKGGEIYEI